MPAWLEERSEPRWRANETRHRLHPATWRRSRRLLRQEQHERRSDESHAEKQTETMT